MKSVKLYITWMLIALIGLSGCKDDALVKGNVGQVEEGIPVTVSVNFFTTPQKTLSRAEQTPETEYNVSTIYLFAFNARGEKTGGQAFMVNGTDATGSYSNESFTGTINRFNVLTGTRQRLYAIANYNSSDFNLTKRQLDAIDTETELLDLSVATRGGRILLNHLSFVMEGEEENVLKSASKLISTKHPVLAICAYHRPEDLFSLVNTITQIDDCYSFYLRKYPNYPYHRYNSKEEIVLYAIPPERLICTIY